MTLNQILINTSLIFTEFVLISIPVSNLDVLSDRIITKLTENVKIVPDSTKVCYVSEVCFTKIANGFYLLTIFAKKFHQRCL